MGWPFPRVPGLTLGIEVGEERNETNEANETNHFGIIFDSIFNGNIFFFFWGKKAERTKI